MYLKSSLCLVAKKLEENKKSNFISVKSKKKNYGKLIQVALQNLSLWNCLMKLRNAIYSLIFLIGAIVCEKFLLFDF